MRQVSLATVSALFLCAACGSDAKAPPADELTPDQVGAWAPTVSALGAYLSIYEPVAVYDGQSVFSDPACPAVQRDDSTLSITGDCTDSNAMIWSGSVTMDLATTTLTFAAFGNGRSIPVVAQSGVAAIADSSPTSRDFTIQLSGSDASSIDYQGHVDGAYDARTLWNGSGTFVRHSGKTDGTADATTTDEVFDNTECDSAPATGTTELHIDDHVAAVTYTGSIDCGGDGVDVTIDGKPKGKVQGVGCSISRNARRERTAGARLTLMLAVMGAAWFSRRKRRRECS